MWFNNDDNDDELSVGKHWTLCLAQDTLDNTLHYIKVI